MLATSVELNFYTFLAVLSALLSPVVSFISVLFDMSQHYLKR